MKTLLEFLNKGLLQIWSSVLDTVDVSSYQSKWTSIGWELEERASQHNVYQTIEKVLESASLNKIVAFIYQKNNYLALNS